MVLTKKTRFRATETSEKVARTPAVAQMMAPILVVDVENTNNSGSLGLGCSGLHGLALLLHILSTFSPRPPQPGLLRPKPQQATYNANVPSPTDIEAAFHTLSLA
ncbi:hypothetical protein AAZX31_09G048000 [Glycine max]